jgi:Tol biopolymer transport system component
MGAQTNPLRVSEAEVREELQRLLDSREFAGAERLSRFLRFVVERTLAADRDSLKESVIGTEVFGRDPGYDPKTEPIVRTSAVRLRAKLDEYYEQPGSAHLVRISIPKGAYLAAFEPLPRPVPLTLPPPEAPRTSPPRKSLWLAATAGVVILAALLLYFGVGQQTPRPQPLVSTVTSYPGHQQQPALSPDGTQVAFVWAGDKGDNRDIYIAMASGGSPRRITTDAAADDNPSWSPDGSTIAFVREGKSLMFISPLGTNERRVTTAYDSKPSWTPDGKAIFFADWLPHGGPLAIFRLDLAAGTRRQITSPAGVYPGDTSVEISPTGREFAFVRNQGASGTLYRMPVEGGEPRLAWRPGHHTFGGIAWSPDGSRIVASAGPAAYLLWSIPTGGGRPQVLPLTGEDNRNPGFGRSVPPRLAWEHTIRDSNIWRLTVGDKRAAPDWQRIVASTRLDSSPQISPDGRSIAFVSDRTGSFQLWRVDADGGNPVQLTNYEYEYPGSPRWSPDGSHIVFDLRADEGKAVFAMDAHGGGLRRATPWNDGTRPSYSRDGLWIYYSDRAADKTLQLFKISASVTAGPVQLTSGGGFGPIDSPDGQTIYYTRGQSELWSIPAGGGEPARVLSSGVTGGWWGVSGRGIFFVDLYPGGAPGLFVANAPKPIYLLPHGSEHPIEVGRIEHEIARETPDFAVSADGRSLLVSILETSSTQIRLLQER